MCQMTLTKSKVYQRPESIAECNSFFFFIGPFPKRHRLVHNGGFPKFEALYCSLNTVVSALRQTSHPDPIQYSHVIIIQLYIYIYIYIYAVLLLRSLKDNYKKITLPSVVVLMV